MSPPTASTDPAPDPNGDPATAPDTVPTNSGTGISTGDRREHVRRHVDRSITLRARLYLLIFTVTLVITIVHCLTTGGWAWALALIGFGIGTLIGFAVSRMNQLTWDQFEQRITGRVDVIGFVILIAYLAFTVFRSRIVGHWVPSTLVAPTSMSVLSGVMLGQVAGIRHGVIKLSRRVLP